MTQLKREAFGLYLAGLLVLAIGRIVHDLRNRLDDDHGGRGSPQIHEDDLTALPLEERHEFEVIEINNDE